MTMISLEGVWGEEWEVEWEEGLVKVGSLRFNQVALEEWEEAWENK